MPEVKNKVQLIGHLGNKPDVRVTDKGKKHVRFSLATNELYMNAKGEAVASTYWHNIVAWGKTADQAEQKHPPPEDANRRRFFGGQAQHGLSA